MRTRRSWRNQDRLWKLLGQDGEAKVATPPPPPILTDAEIDAMWHVSKSSRSLMKRDAARRRLKERHAAPS